ncbi:alpha/beta hydrolase [Geomonas sp. RF6]|uniref:alpha/beta fold hydrolase n=1 Tax=Geomonas sp. RF6 TaxID=2897342 RepID=UPI001E5A59C0|nr:alpha/beta hydrolase [Geomonas sp. RF6]UFS71068.1 alpha/beta hydrolase [Geomonas sp. RF6]
MPPITPGYLCTGDGDAVVLLHSSLSSKNQWKGLIPLLAGRYRVIAVDLYGYGETPFPPDKAAFSLRDEVELVREVLERELPAGAVFHLVGHSYGGAVALSFCHYYPESVRSVCAFEPVAFHLLDLAEPQLSTVLQMAQTLERLGAQGKPELAAETFLDYWGGPGTFAAYPARLKEDFAARTPKLRLDFQAITRTAITVEDYRRLQLPVHLIVGERSRPPALFVTEVLSRTLPHCTLHKVPAGHLAPFTHPQLVNPLIAQTLR